MEIALKRLDEGSILVLCDNEESHKFELNNLISENDIPKFVENIIQDPKFYGKELYHALFPPDTLAQRMLYSTPDRILLVIDDFDLQKVPWEYAYGPHGFIILDFHFVRGLSVDKRRDPPVIGEELHIVAVPSNPLDNKITHLDIDGEWLRLREIVTELKYNIKLERTRPATLDRLRQLVTNQHNSIIHFIGHGCQGISGAELVFENEDGSPYVSNGQFVTAQDFTRRIKNKVFLVVLNACASADPGQTEFGNIAAALVEQGAPYALGMRLSIHDDDARAFSRIFYSDLARGASVEEALLQARLKLSTSPNSWALGVPVLYTSLNSRAPGFVCVSGVPKIEEHQPKMVIYDIPRCPGTFYGRTDILRSLGEKLTGDSRPKVVTIFGAGGQGKTVLAREAVERFAYSWPGGVLAISLEKLPSRNSLLTILARFLGISTEQNEYPREIEQQVLLRLGQQRTLIVFDNAETLIYKVEDDDESIRCSAKELSEFILRKLPGPQVSLLFTSRIPLEYPGEVTIYLGGLDPIEGACLFLQSAPQRTQAFDLLEGILNKNLNLNQEMSNLALAGNVSKNEIIDLAITISNKVDGHPLSLCLLGYAFNANQLSPDDFVKDYDFALNMAENKYLGEGNKQHKIYASIDISMQYLNDDLRNFLSKLYVFHDSFLPEVVVAILDRKSLADSYEFRGSLFDIGAPVNIAEINLRGIHANVPDFPIGEETMIYNQLDNLFRRGLLTREMHFIRHNEEGSYVLLYRLLPVLSNFIEDNYKIDGIEKKFLIAKFGDVYSVLASVLGSEIRRDPIKVHIAQRSIEDLKQGVKFVSPRKRNDYLLGLGAILLQLGETQNANKLSEEAINFTKSRKNTSEFGNLDEKTEIADELDALILSAVTSIQLKKMEKAMEQLRLAQSICREKKELIYEADIYEANIFLNMGHVYYEMSNYNRSLESFRQAGSIFNEKKDRNGNAKILDGMALVYLASGKNKQAQELLEKALDLLDVKDSTAYEEEDLASKANILHNLGEAYRRLGMKDLALKRFEDSLKLRRNIDDRWYIPITLYNIACVHDEKKNYNKARDFYGEALLIGREVGNKAVEGAVLISLASNIFINGSKDELKAQEAEKMLREAALIFKNIGNVAFEASALASLGIFLYNIRGETEEPIKLFNRSIRLLEEHNLSQDAGGGTIKQHRDFLAKIAQSRISSGSEKGIIRLLHNLMNRI